MSHEPNIVCAYHLNDALDPVVSKRVVKAVCKLLREMEAEKDLTFDAIAVRGLSGLLVAPIVAMRLNKTLLCVRKGESCHSSNVVEGDVAAKNYIVLDDFVSSGSTVREVIEAVATAAPLARCVGMVSYHQLNTKDEVNGSYAYRVEHAFDTAENLRLYSDVIKTQDVRIRDTRAQGQSKISLDSLAAWEERRRSFRRSINFGA